MGSALSVFDPAGLAGYGDEAGVGGECSGVGVAVEAAGVGDELGGEDRAHAGQAGGDRGEVVAGQCGGDEFLDGGDAVVDGLQVAGELGDDLGGGGLAGDGDGLGAGGGAGRCG
ncbi:hypothetical protein [Planosporangium thailandense]|uniref:hypothetical protein n=1 Tax=Planosporangium thailandense TaxID=765197 RepID=UPI0030B83309